MKPRLNEIRRARPLLGTFVEITVGGLSEILLHRAAGKAFQAIEHVQRLMSFHEENSDVTRLNRFAFQKPIKVHPWTYRVLRTAQRISLKTSGLFDISIASVLMNSGYLPRMMSLAIKQSGTFRDIRFLSGGRIRFLAPLAIDLGGIAKGFAVDQAVKTLKKMKVRYGSVNAGGDLRIFGNKVQPVYVRNPNSPGEIMLIARARETAVASSALYFAIEQNKNKKDSPFINPKTKISVKAPYGITVFSKTCMIADALTKPLMIETKNTPYLAYFSARAIMVKDNSEEMGFHDAT